MEILKNFGVNQYLLVAQIVNFLIVFYILKRLLYKPFLSMLKKRQEEIKKGIESAEQGQKILTEATEQERAMLKKAEETSNRIIEDARRESSELAKEIEGNTKKQTEKMLSQATEKIELETKQAEERLIKEVGKIAISLLEKTLPEVLDKNQQEEVLKKAASKIQNG